MKNLMMIAMATVTLMVMQPVKAQVKTPDPEMLKELKSYAVTNIKPVAKPFREKLEKEMTDAERKQVSALRKQLDDIRKHRTDAHLTFRERLVQRELNDEQKKIIAADRKQIRKIMVEALAVADKHESLIDQISAATEKDREKWRKDMKEIVVKYKGEDAGFKLGRLEGGLEGIAAVGSVHPALFVLWDPAKEYLK